MYHSNKKYSDNETNWVEIKDKQRKREEKRRKREWHRSHICDEMLARMLIYENGFDD